MSPIRYLELLAGIILIGFVLWDAFETIVLPRTVQRRFRLTRIVVLFSWSVWRALPVPASAREGYLSFFGPLVLLFLMIIWAAGLILGFALVYLCRALYPQLRHVRLFQRLHLLHTRPG